MTWPTDDLTTVNLDSDADSPLLSRPELIAAINKIKAILANAPLDFAAITGTNFLQSGTGAVTRTNQNKMRDMINVFDFMSSAQITDVQTRAKTLNVSVPIQNAINEAKGRPVYLPIGTYMITSQIELNWSTSAVDIYQAGTKLIGEDQTKTIIVNRAADYGLKHSVSVAQAAIAGAGARFTNGELSNFTITKDGSSAAGAAGIKLFSFWFGYIHDISISGLDNHGLFLPVDAGINANSDRYSCGVLKLERVDIRGNVGWGIRADLWAIIWRILDSYVVSNTVGGIYTTGPMHEIADNSIAGNGGSTTMATSAGLHIVHGGVGTPHNSFIFNNEFDNNWGCHVKLQGYNNLIERNRFIQDGAQGVGGTAFRNTYVVNFGASGSVVELNRMENNLCRFDNASTYAITAVYLDPAGTPQSNTFVDTVFIGAGSGLTKYNFPTNRARNIATEYGLMSAGGDQNTYTTGQVAAVTVSFTTLLGIAATQIPFVALYDSHTRVASNALTIAYSGILMIDFNAVLQPVTTANIAVKIYIYKNGVVYHTQEIPNGFAPLTANVHYPFNLTMKVLAGDVITIYGSSATASTVYFVSDTTATTTFQMV